MQNKRGQFYLLAAIIIVAIIVGFVGITNIAKKSKNTKIYDMGEELGIEGDHVLEYGVFSGGELQSTMEGFTKKYESYAGRDKDLIFIFGMNGNLYALTWEEIKTGSISVGNSRINLNQYQGTSEPIIPDSNGIINIEFKGIIYTFELEEGQNFYFVISQNVNGEEYVVTG